MITVEKVQIFKRFGGNYDAFLSEGSLREKSIFGEGEWSEIEYILGDLAFEKRNRLPHQHDSDSDEITLTPMTDEQYAIANEQANRFADLVADAEYESVLRELWEVA